MTKPSARTAETPSSGVELFPAHAVLAVRPAEKPYPLNDGPLFDPKDTPPRPRRTARKTAKATVPAQIDTPAPSWIASARRLATKAATITDEPTGQSITAIETRYAGCRFRSRLEARWAVWLDHLGIKWRYEPETFMVGPKDRRRGYLPDFYLPEDQIWLEVKGDETALDYQKMIDAADPSGLPFKLGAPAPDQWPTLQIRMVMLGEVPRQPGFHFGLAVLLGQQVARQLVVPFCDMKVIGKPNQLAKMHSHSLAPTFYPIHLGHDIDPDEPEAQPTGLLTSFGYGPPCPQVEGAYVAARSARFEHGESGAPNPVRATDPPASRSTAPSDATIRGILTRLERSHDPKTLAGRSAILRGIAPTLALIVSDARRLQWISKVAERLGYDNDITKVEETVDVIRLIGPVSDE